MATTAFSSPPWWTKDTVAVVTGANKGVGYEIVRLLAEQGLKVVLTARDEGRGQAALDALKAGGLESLWFHQLDVQSSESVKSLATWLKSEFGGIDILVNNAGIAWAPAGDFVSYENAKIILDTNYYGVKNVTKGLLPLLRPSPAAARIVNVTSGMGGSYQRLQSEKLKEIFRDEDKYTEELVDSLAAEYLEDVKADQWDDKWIAGHFQVYSVSKMLMNAYSIWLARCLSKLQPENHQILVVSFSPGLTETDLMKTAAELGFQFPPTWKQNTPAEGADTGVWLALLPKEELTQKHGKMFRDRTEYAFADG